MDDAYNFLRDFILCLIFIGMFVISILAEAEKIKLLNNSIELQNQEIEILKQIEIKII